MTDRNNNQIYYPLKKVTALPTLNFSSESKKIDWQARHKKLHFAHEQEAFQAKIQ